MKKISVVFTTLLVEKSPQALPLGAACCASAVKNHPLTKDFCDVSLYATSVEDEDFIKANTSPDSAAEFLAEQISKYKKDNQEKFICCFSIYMWNRIILEKTAAILKKNGALVLCGGPEVTAHPEVFKAFDGIIPGEGENKVPELIGKLLMLPPVESNQKENSDKNCIKELIYSSPYLDGTLDPSDYDGALWELARGCPFKCSYCYESKGEKSVRLFPMERIEAELDLFARKKIGQVFVLDPTYNANKERALKILNLLKKKTPDTFYYFEARAEFIDKQLAKAFTQIPCAIQIGLQSANEEVLKLLNRPTNKKTFTKNIGFLNEEGAIFGFDLIYGLPGDTFKSFKESIDFALSLYPNNLEIFCLSVLPGTDLYDRAEELHLTYESEPPYHVLHTDKFSAQDLNQAKKIANACNIFYNDGRAVPWFNSICKAAKIRGSQFFVLFAEYLGNKKINCRNHKEIENIQIDFVKQLLQKNHQEKYIKLACDLIIFNGALSRTQDTGKSEKIDLNYDSEYLASEYAADLQFFIQNIKMHQNTTETFKNGNFADFKKVKR